MWELYATIIAEKTVLRYMGGIFPNGSIMVNGRLKGEVCYVGRRKEADG